MKMWRMLFHTGSHPVLGLNPGPESVRWQSNLLHFCTIICAGGVFLLEFFVHTDNKHTGFENIKSCEMLPERNPLEYNSH